MEQAKGRRQSRPIRMTTGRTCAMVWICESLAFSGRGNRTSPNRRIGAPSGSPTAGCVRMLFTEDSRFPGLRRERLVTQAPVDEIRRQRKGATPGPGSRLCKVSLLAQLAAEQPERDERSSQQCERAWLGDTWRDVSPGGKPGRECAVASISRRRGDEDVLCRKLSDWDAYRLRWEVGHALAAALSVIAFFNLTRQCVRNPAE